jgi:hypothetical protein
MRLTLLLPGLLWPRQALRDTVFDLSAPALSLMLGRGQARWTPAATAHGWLAGACGIEPADAPPLAALRLLGEGGEPADGHWLCLDPLHLRLEEWSLVVDDPARLALSPDEDAALRRAAAPLFADWGTLHALSPGRWYLDCKEPPAIMTAALDGIVGRPLDPQLPAGPQAAAWRQRLAQAQTLLHAEPVNRGREAAGKPVVNSLWPWGGGRLAARPKVPWTSVWGDDAVVAGLGAAAGIEVRPLPDRFAPAASDALVLLDSLSAPAQAMDALAWRQMLMTLEDDWLAPALAALRRGRIEALRLVAFGGEASLDLTLTPWAVRRFWHRPQPLTALAP